MKIIHTADFHLGSALKSHLNVAKAKIRQQELLDAFQRVINYANDNNIKVMILAGDVFDSAKSSTGIQKDFIKLINKYPNIDFIYTLGNHDERGLNYDGYVKPDNLYMGTDAWQAKQYDDVVINYVNFNSTSEKALYKTLQLDENKKNIVVLHGEVTNYGEKGKIQLSKLANKNINYLALGHIHMNSINQLDDKGIYVYSGCLEGRGFDEEGEKGFYVIDTDDMNHPKFIVNSKRIVYKLDVSIDGCNDWIDYLNKVDIATKDIQAKDIVEIIITGHYPIDLVKKTDSLVAKLNEDYFFGKVKDLSQLEINPKDYENSPTFKGQFMKMVMDSDGYTPEEKKQIIEVGIHAMMGDEF